MTATSTSPAVPATRRWWRGRPRLGPALAVASLVLAGVAASSGTTADAFSAIPSVVYPYSCTTTFAGGATYAGGTVDVRLADTLHQPGVYPYPGGPVTARIEVAVPVGAAQVTALNGVGTTDWTSSDARIVWDGVSSPPTSFAWHAYPYPVSDQVPIAFTTASFPVPGPGDVVPGALSWDFQANPGAQTGFETGHTQCNPVAPVQIYATFVLASGPRARTTGSAGRAGSPTPARPSSGRCPPTSTTSPSTSGARAARTGPSTATSTSPGRVGAAASPSPPWPSPPASTSPSWSGAPTASTVAAPEAPRAAGPQTCGGRRSGWRTVWSSRAGVAAAGSTSAAPVGAPITRAAPVAGSPASARMAAPARRRAAARPRLPSDPNFPSSDGMFGAGGAGFSGGGGGYYGGGGGTLPVELAQGGGGGGGSGFVPAGPGNTTVAGANSGYGSIAVSYTSTTTPYTSRYTTDEANWLLTDLKALHTPDLATTQHHAALFMTYFAALIRITGGTLPNLGSAPGSGPIAVTSTYTRAENASLLRSAALFRSDPPTVQRTGVAVLAFLAGKVGH